MSAAFSREFAHAAISRSYPGLWELWTDGQRAEAIEVAEQFRPVFETACDALAAWVEEARRGA